MRRLIPFALASLLLCSSGCSILFDATVDAALESKEERHIRKDRKRARDGQPMKHHKDWEDLNAHSEDIERRRAEE